MLNISVVIPVYNAGNFLEKAVESALQFPEVREIILVEDGSPDHSLEVCRFLEKKHDLVKVFQHPNAQNKGAGASRNLGIEKASQEFIAFLDADDVFTHLRFTAEKEYFNNPKIDGVFGGIGVQFLSEKGKKEFQEKFKDTQLTTVKYAAEGEEIFKGLIDEKRNFGTFFSLIALTVRKVALEREGLTFNENLRVHQDQDFIQKLAYHCYLKTGIIDQAVSLRGVHDDNRITKIKLYSSQYRERQFQLWKSQYDWISKVKINPEIKKIITLKYLSFKISQKKGFTKWFSLLVSLFLYPDILKTRYRFHYLGR